MTEAVAACFVEETGGLPGEYRFSHALVREALLHEMSRVGRARQHLAIARALDAIAAEGRPSTAEELAYHFAEAAAEAGTERMTHYALRCADAAMQEFAYEHALAVVERALAVKRRIAEGREPDLEEAELLYRRATAQRHAGRGVVVDRTHARSFGESLGVLRHAFDAFVANGAIDRAVELALSEVYLDGESLPDLRRRCLRLVEKGSALEARLLLGDAWDAVWRSSPPWQLYDEVASLTAQLKDPALQAAARLYRAVAQTCHGAVDEGIAAIDGVLEHAAANAWPGLLGVAHYSSIHARWRAGRVTDARAAIRAMRDACGRDPRLRPFLSIIDHAEAVIHFHTGEFALARSACQCGSSRTAKRLTSYAGLDGLGVYGEAVTTGGAAAAQLVVGSWAEEGRPNAALMALGLCRLFGYPELVEAAARGSRAVLAADVAEGERLTARFVLALAGCIRGEAAEAREQYPHLSFLSGLMAPGKMSAICADRLLGLLCTTAGDFEQALAHFAAAVSFCDRSGFRPELAWTYYDRAGLLIRRARARARDRDAARSDLELALRLTRDLGMAPLAALAQLRLDDLGGPDARTPSGGLTPRELEVLELVVRGLTNAEIGERLSISPHTAATHVQHILEKTGMSNRADLTAHAVRNRLVD